MNGNGGKEEIILLDEMGGRDDTASSKSTSPPWAASQSELTEDVELDEELLTAESDKNNSDVDKRDGSDDEPSSPAGQKPPVAAAREASSSPDGDAASPSPDGGAASPSPGGDGQTGGVRSQASRRIVVSPRPGDDADDDSHDSGNQSDKAEPAIPEENAAPALPPKSRSPPRSPSASSRSSCSPEPQVRKKGGSSQAPRRFKNDVEPAEYHRQPAPRGGAHYSVQCKAMLVIMGSSIAVVFVVIALILLQAFGGDSNNTKELNGTFYITNRVYNASYNDTESLGYATLTDEFIKAVNFTLEADEVLFPYYKQTTVYYVASYYLSELNISDTNTARPLIDFSVSLESKDDWTVGSVAVLLDNTTASNQFGNFTGLMDFGAA